jgi:hypothetical protein
MISAAIATGFERVEKAMLDWDRTRSGSRKRVDSVDDLFDEPI